ncbi:MAG: hypothetical protein AB1349_13100 [Elusimicrobiota bacterium]
MSDLLKNRIAFSIIELFAGLFLFVVSIFVAVHYLVTTNYLLLSCFSLFLSLWGAMICVDAFFRIQNKQLIGGKKKTDHYFMVLIFIFWILSALFLSLHYIFEKKNFSQALFYFTGSIGLSVMILSYMKNIYSLKSTGFLTCYWY